VVLYITSLKTLITKTHFTTTYLRLIEKELDMKKYGLMSLIVALSLVLLACKPVVVPETDEIETPSIEMPSIDATAVVEPVTEPVVQVGFLPGKKAIDVSLNDINGNLVSLSDFEGQVVVLNFFASWCPPCKAEMPYINEAYIENKDNGLVVLGINLTEQDELEDMYQLLEEDEIAFPILLDEKSTAAKNYKVRSIPTSVFINAQGIITDYHVGTVNKEQFMELVEKAKK
jgi:peroxiredoxin